MCIWIITIKNKVKIEDNKEIMIILIEIFKTLKYSGLNKSFVHRVENVFNLLLVYLIFQVFNRLKLNYS